MGFLGITLGMNVELLKRLTEAHGVSGQEDAIRQIVREELKDICRFHVDAMGNLHCIKAPTDAPKNAPPRRLMIAAHMDEIGFVVKYIDDKGFLRIQTLGGWDPRQMFSQRVVVHTKGGPLPGLLIYQTKPRHMLTPEEEKKPPEIENFFVDVGMSAKEAKRKIRLGDMVTMSRPFQQMGKLMTCKSMDDRVGVYVMIEALKAVRRHQVEVHAVATVQEEVGLRGAMASGWSVKPDIAVALDVTLANDYPGIPEGDQVTKLGAGAAIKLMDSSLICHPRVVEHFRSLAEKHKIPHQIEILPRGGTDAGGIQRLHGGIPSFTLSVPTRYIHTVNETVHADDVDACVKLLARYIEDAHRGKYEFS